MHMITIVAVHVWERRKCALMKIEWKLERNHISLCVVLYTATASAVCMWFLVSSFMCSWGAFERSHIDLSWMGSLMQYYRRDMKWMSHICRDNIYTPRTGWFLNRAGNGQEKQYISSESPYIFRGDPENATANPDGGSIGKWVGKLKNGMEWLRWMQNTNTHSEMITAWPSS